MKTVFLALSVLALAGTGCSLVGCDRVFPHLTWYWSAEAKRCRDSHQVGEELAKEWAPESTNRVAHPK